MNFGRTKFSGITHGPYMDVCISMFIASLFTMGKLWKQPRYSLINEWIKMFVGVHTLESYSAIKNNEI